MVSVVTFREVIRRWRCAMRLEWMRCSVAAVAGIAALAVSSIALAAGGVAGTYKTTIKSPATIKGTWVLTLKAGTYKVSRNGQALARGTYTATATTITLREPAGCGGAGTYAWKKSGRTMIFVRKREAASCQIRGVVLSHRFTQVG
jgi:hypothetical protein